jgi:TatD DNase family protein
MRPVDAHCHIDFEQYDEDREEVIDEAKEKLEFIVNAGSNLENNREVLDLSREHEEFIIPNLGLHPTYTDSFGELDDIKAQIREEMPAAVGEIGLDHHHVSEKQVRKRQEKIFREMLELAEKLNLSVVVHSRDAEKKTVDILKEYALPDVMVHCFNGKPELAEEAVEEGMTIGVTTQVLYSNRVQEIVKALNADDILLETDSPFLYRGERNSPVKVLESVEKVAEIKNVDEEKVIQASTENAVSIFGRP